MLNKIIIYDPLYIFVILSYYKRSNQRDVIERNTRSKGFQLKLFIVHIKITSYWPTISQLKCTLACHLLCVFAYHWSFVL